MDLFGLVPLGTEPIRSCRTLTEAALAGTGVVMAIATCTSLRHDDAGSIRTVTLLAVLALVRTSLLGSVYLKENGIGVLRTREIERTELYGSGLSLLLDTKHALSLFI